MAVSAYLDACVSPGVDEVLLRIFLACASFIGTFLSGTSSERSETGSRAVPPGAFCGSLRRMKSNSRLIEAGGASAARFLASPGISQTEARVPEVFSYLATKPATGVCNS